MMTSVEAEEWRRRLIGLLDEGLETHGDHHVRAVLRAEIERLDDASGPPPLVVEVPVLGVHACATGWVGVLLSPHRPPAVLAGSTIAALVELARESAEVDVVAIDVPVGTSRGDGPESAQEVDDWLRARPGVEVAEVHAELAFARMTGAPVAASRDIDEGARARRAALESAGLVAPGWFRGSPFGEDDLLDACAAAWTAVRDGRGGSVPGGLREWRP